MLQKLLVRRVALQMVMAACAFSAVTPASLAATFMTLASFNGDNGANPFAGLIADAAGNLYGTTLDGGSSNYGTIFQLEAGTNTLTTLASFNYENGAYPSNDLIADAAGNLYGTTYQGGASTFGTVFRLEAGTSTITTITEFNVANGARPYGGLIADAAGNLYGTTYAGGPNFRGTVYRIEAGTNTLTTLASFDGANGEGARARLLADSAGNFYSTTEYGGVSGFGTVFRLDAGTNTLTAIALFNNENGAHPIAGLVADATGNLYGTTVKGGENNRGTVFRVDAGTNTLTTLVSFNGANGASPIASLIADVAGNLYGTTESGGEYNYGTVFRIEASTNILTTLASFSDQADEPTFPTGSLIADAVGNLYGTSRSGGVSNLGTIFRITDAGFVVPEPGNVVLCLTVSIFLVGRVARRRDRVRSHS